MTLSPAEQWAIRETETSMGLLLLMHYLNRPCTARELATLRGAGYHSTRLRLQKLEGVWVERITPSLWTITARTVFLLMGLYQQHFDQTLLKSSSRRDVDTVDKSARKDHFGDRDDQGGDGSDRFCAEKKAAAVKKVGDNLAQVSTGVMPGKDEGEAKTRGTIVSASRPVHEGDRNDPFCEQAFHILQHAGISEPSALALARKISAIIEQEQEVIQAWKKSPAELIVYLLEKQNVGAQAAWSAR